MNKHLLILAIAILLICVGLSGCIESNEHEDAQSDGEGDTEPEEDEDTEPNEEENQEEEWIPEYGINYTVTVTSVIDGDTFDAIFPDGSEERIRLLGVDTPETTASNNEEYEYGNITNLSCLASYGLEAKNFAETWLEDETIYIQFDSSAGFKGYYGRWLAYVFISGSDFNELLLENGYARVYTEGACSKESYYVTLQNQAMTDRVGLWSCMQEETPDEPASFSYYPSNPTTSDTIQFIDTSTSSEGTIIDWYWDFGDNTISTGQNPTHKYSSEGNYRITLTVKNDKNSVNSTTLTIAVNTDDVLGEIIIFEEQNPGDIFISPEETGKWYWRVKTTDFLEQFYQVYDDCYDFIVMVPTKLISSSYSSGVNSNTYGIGKDPSPIDSYPSIDRLRSLAAWSPYNHYYWSGNTTEYLEVADGLEVITHEIGHHWLVHININGRSDGPHWPYNIDLFSGDSRYIDLMGYYHWIIKGDEEICVDASCGIDDSDCAIDKFSNISLYLMGLIPPEKVPPIFVHEFENRSEEGIYQNYNTRGPRCSQEYNFIENITVTIEDIIEKYGERTPSYDISQKNFRVVFVILTEKDEEVPSDFLDYIDQCREALPGFWGEVTFDHSKIEC